MGLSKPGHSIGRFESIPATTLYQQIERLQKERAESESKRNALIEADSKQEQTAKPIDYERFLVRMMRMVKENPSFETKKAIVGALVHRVEIHENGFKLGFYVGAGQIKKGEALASPSFLKDNIFLSSGSFLLKNGGLERVRTYDLLIRSQVL